jgi:hypothetical protein
VEQRREQADKRSGLRRTSAGVSLGLLILITIPASIKSIIQEIRQLPNPELSLAAVGSSLATVFLLGVVSWLIYSGVQRYKTIPTILKVSTASPPSPLPIPLQNFLSQFLTCPELDSDNSVEIKPKLVRDNPYEARELVVLITKTFEDNRPEFASNVYHLYTQDLKEHQDRGDKGELLASEYSIGIFQSVIRDISEHCDQMEDQVEALKKKIQDVSSEPEYVKWAEGLTLNMKSPESREFLRAGTPTPPLPTTEENSSGSEDPQAPDSPSSESSDPRNPSPTQYTLNQTFLPPPLQESKSFGTRIITEDERVSSDFGI